MKRPGSAALPSGTATKYLTKTFPSPPWGEGGPRSGPGEGVLQKAR
jgi:hypothetical protein